MRIRGPGDRGGRSDELPMVAMIDVVFQLLVFFILTFQVVTLEGDFRVAMPNADAAGRGWKSPPIITVRLLAGNDGKLVAIEVNHRRLTGATAAESLRQLNTRAMAEVATAADPRDVELEIQFDAHLRYQDVVEAITAATGYVDAETGRPVRLVERIRFLPAT